MNTLVEQFGPAADAGDVPRGEAPSQSGWTPFTCYVCRQKWERLGKITEERPVCPRCERRHE